MSLRQAAENEGRNADEGDFFPSVRLGSSHRPLDEVGADRPEQVEFGVAPHEHSVFVMNTGGHEYFFAGSHRVIDQAPPPASTSAWAHIGATLAARAAEERDGRLVVLDTVDAGRSLMASSAARDAATAGFRGLVGLEQPGPIRPNAGELSTFTDRGYRAAFAVIGLHSWFHTPADTLDTVDARTVVPVLEAHKRTIELLTDPA